MSTKIYNAFKVPGLKNSSELFSFIYGDFKNSLNETRDFIDASLMVQNLVYKIDRESFKPLEELTKDKAAESGSNANEKDTLVVDKTEAINGLEHLESPIAETVEEWLEQQKKERPGTIFHDPHEFSASIGYSEKEQSLLLLAHHNNQEYNDCLKNTLNLQDWHYQNQSDKPESISNEEWLARRESWDEVMPEGVPSESMLSFNLRSKLGGVTYGSGLDLELLVSRIHCKDHESVHPAVAKAFDTFMRTNRIERTNRVSLELLGNKVASELGSRKFMSKYVIGSHGRKVQKRISAELFALLPQITLDDLWDKDVFTKYNVHHKFSSDVLDSAFNVIDDIIFEDKAHS